MPALTSYTKPLTELQASHLRTLLVEKGFQFEEKPYCLYAASGQKVNVAVYMKGPKILVQGKGTEDFVKFTLEPEVLGAAELGYEEVLHPEMFEPHIGVDESGKGDFFGPLVIAGAYVDKAMAQILLERGVMDSKRISSDARITALAGQMRSAGVKHEVIVITPERVPDCPRALSDQFANPKVLQSALQSRGKTIVLEQRTKAESDPAVAAASIFAREKFVQWLDSGGAKYSIPLPKGVSPAVKANALRIARLHGREALASVAKMHFRTAAEILGGC